MTETLDWRAFLQRTLAAAGTLPLVARTGASDRRGGNRVVVLGAELAGLSAAHSLMKHGYEVTVLEAQDLPVRTFETHEHTQKWVRAFGLEQVPYDTGTQAYHPQGKRFLAPTAGEPWRGDGERQAGAVPVAAGSRLGALPRLR